MIGKIKDPNIVKSGTEYMVEGMKWYMRETKNTTIGMFQIGGGISGDFPACIVPTIISDFRGILPEVPFWGYHCQICDSTTSYGSFSGCTPSEKISWAKLSKDTPAFIIESDATIVAPLIFEYVMGN
jgi:deoxyhypusine synthase